MKQYDIVGYPTSEPYEVDVMAEESKTGAWCKYEDVDILLEALLNIRDLDPYSAKDIANEALKEVGYDNI